LLRAWVGRTQHELVLHRILNYEFPSQQASQILNSQFLIAIAFVAFVAGIAGIANYEF